VGLAAALLICPATGAVEHRGWKTQMFDERIWTHLVVGSTSALFRRVAGTPKRGQKYLGGTS
jgi:hypothetical protein